MWRPLRPLAIWYKNNIWKIIIMNNICDPYWFAGSLSTCYRDIISRSNPVASLLFIINRKATGLWSETKLCVFSFHQVDLYLSIFFIYFSNKKLDWFWPNQMDWPILGGSKGQSLVELGWAKSRSNLRIYVETVRWVQCEL